MGNIIFTAKKILDNSSVATWIADGGDMLLKAMGVVSQKGDSGVDLLIGDVPDKPVEETKSKCIAQVRPKSGWHGEFGFDWFRIADTWLPGDSRYEDIVGRYYTKSPEQAGAKKNSDGNTWTAFFKNDPQPSKFAAENRLKRLQALYGSFKYTMGKESDGKPKIKDYYFPRLALFPKATDPSTKKVTETGTAELELHLQFEQVDGKTPKPIRLEFEVDGKICDGKHPLVTVDPAVMPGNKLGKNATFKITCNAEFDTDKDVKIWAVEKDKDGKEENLLAGLFKMIAPKKKRDLDVVVVRVVTDAGPGKRKSMDEFNRNLRQSLIQPHVVEIDAAGKDVSIDVTDPAKNYNKINFMKEYGVSAKNIANSEGKSMNLLHMLDKQLELKYPGVYSSHFRLYFLNNTCDKTEIKDATGTVIGTAATAGYSYIKSSHGIMFDGHTATTIGHECMHGLGLEHTFFEEAFMFKAMQTDNIMDYSHLTRDKATGAANTPKDRVSSNYWQWKIINPKI